MRDRKVDLLVGAQRVRETFKGAIGGKLPGTKLALAFLDLPWRRLPSDNGFNSYCFSSAVVIFVRVHDATVFF